ncbi:PEP-CTERM sorting domain-containing protein [candidate division WOR-3 bacterium]|nr:PEP-CTERM sorting domain-containing protein [candidate division WOR-3 bacterium]
MKIRNMTLILVIGCVLAFSPRAYSAPILQGFESPIDSGSWTASDADRYATAVFSIDGNDLKIVLTNLATLTDENDELLMGLFFGFTGDLTDPPSVALNTGSSLGTDGVDIVDADGKTIDPDDYPTNLNGEFGYLTDINGINGGRGDYGISSSGLDPTKPVDPSELWDGFGEGTIIDPDLQIYTTPKNPLAPNGPDFGITGPDGWDGSNALAYINNSVIITWEGDSGLDVNNIDQVHFLYGTDYDNIPIPEPATMLLLGTGLIGLGWVGRKKIDNS